jgi:hypothetical protein
MMQFLQKSERKKVNFAIAKHLVEKKASIKQIKCHKRDYLVKIERKKCFGLVKAKSSCTIKRVKAFVGEARSDGGVVFMHWSSLIFSHFFSRHLSYTTTKITSSCFVRNLREF